MADVRIDPTLARAAKAHPWWRSARSLRILCALLALIFFACAALEPFDPRGLLWIMAYGYVAMCALMGALNVGIFWPSTLGVIGMLISVGRTQTGDTPEAWTAWGAVAVASCLISLLFVGLSERWRRQGGMGGHG